MNHLPRVLTQAQAKEALKPKRRHKYGVASAEDRTYKGRTYRSKLEATYAQSLDLLVRAGAVEEWWYEVRYPLRVNDVLLGQHLIDFKVLYSDGRLTFVECKGFDHPLGKWKRKHCEAQYKFKIEVVKAK